jgi:hypothetical protein
MAVRRFVMLLSLAIVAFAILRAFGDLRRRTGPSLPHGPDVGSPGDDQSGRDTFAASLMRLRARVDAGDPISDRMDDGIAVMRQLVYLAAGPDSQESLPALTRVSVLSFKSDDGAEHIALNANGQRAIESVSVVFIHPSQVADWRVARVDAYEKDGFGAVEDRQQWGVGEEAVDWLRMRWGARCRTNCRYEWYVFYPGCIINFTSKSGISSEDSAVVDGLAESVAKKVSELHLEIDRFGRGFRSATR